MTEPSPAVPDWATRALSTVFDPCCREKGISVIDMGLLRSVTVRDGQARVELLLTSGWCPFAARVVADVETAIRRQPGVETCEVEIVWDEVWTTDRLSPSAARRLQFLPDPVAVPDRDAFVSAHRSQPPAPAQEDDHDRRRIRVRRGRAPVQLHPQERIRVTGADVRQPPVRLPRDADPGQ